MDRKLIEDRFASFNDATDRFYAKELSVKDYKGISGGMGSYAQKGAEKSMVRLRLAGGRISKAKLDFICDCISRYNPEKVHITTCQSVQLHGLGPEAVKAIVAAAPDYGIFTYGGGGDYPRNVTATPMSGLITYSRFDVMPYAQAVEEYIMEFSVGKKLPRKLKIGFSSTVENVTDATCRDLGFVAREDGKFDVYAGGGLGRNPKLGLLVTEGADPSEVFAYANAMFRLFAVNGNYEDRSKARVRYMRDTMGDEGFMKGLLANVTENLSDPAFPRASVSPIVISKKGDGSVPSAKRVKPQCQDGLYYVIYHPIGGDPAIGKFAEIRGAIAGIDQAEVRVSPTQSLYVINLTGSEADKIASILSDGAATVFESSVSCVGATICQVGNRDSAGLLQKLVEMERANGFADRVLPMMRISGCANSCAAHQVGTIALAGSASIDGEPAFTLFVNGSHMVGKERLGLEIGSIKESELPAFFETIGKAVVASGAGTFLNWFNGNPDVITDLCGRYLH